MHGDRLYSLKDFYFDLPEPLVAQYPSEKRSESRLFVLDRSCSEYKHKLFFEIEEFLCEGDVLVINNAKVIPARIFFKRKSGGLVEIVLTRRMSGMKWLVISNKTKKLKTGEILFSTADPSVEICVLGRSAEYLQVESNCELTEEVLKEIGAIPLPPYIRREPTAIDEERYQTVYASAGEAAAAPTAGLHFTAELMSRLKRKGVGFAELTLDVSWGTFQPVREDNLTKHKMHFENYCLSEQSAFEINNARSEKRRIIAVGTTSLRVLESSFRNGINESGNNATDIFIYPPYEIKSIDALITNFHTPYSTLLMLVSAFAGYNKIMDAYKTAVQEKYRFFSYGDAMLIL
ncbi:MAG: tRNA preQ1(34) S-adenosylmethionine ribosyltransferase-isomerase QueA [Spirochaetes bacterium]|nr:tRNA preQ1(34) S-adenosylmethionine ribosyltransferase-isomerase QueA [Spirochaetota bacterium]